jgi:hypothetical protein
MNYGAFTPLLGREFDNFLFASIGEERNGMALSVLSALSRLDVDAWQETAGLARMPRDQATERLTALIAAAPMDLATSLSPATIAARLVALLPQAASAQVPGPEALFKVAAARPSRLFIALGVAALVLAAFFVFTTHPSGGRDPNPTAASGEAAAPR